MQLAAAVAIHSGSPQWQFAVAVRSGNSQWQFAVAICSSSGNPKWQLAATVVVRISQLQPKVAVHANRRPHHKSQCVNNQAYRLHGCGERDNFVGLATFAKPIHLNISKLQLHIVATELHKAKKLRIYTVNTQRTAQEEVYVNRKS